MHVDFGRVNSFSQIKKPLKKMYEHSPSRPLKEDPYHPAGLVLQIGCLVEMKKTHGT